MYRHLLPPLFALAAPSSISLFCLAIATVSFTAQFILDFHLTNACNTICLTFLTASALIRALSTNPAARASNALQAHSRSPPTRIPPLPPTPHDYRLGHDVQDSYSFLDLSSEDSFQDSGLGLSTSSLDDEPSEDEGFTIPLKIPDTNLNAGCPAVGRDPTSSFRDEPSPPLSESSFQLSAPDTPRTDYGGDGECITLGVMLLQRNTIRGCQAEAHEDLIMSLIDRLEKLNLGSTPSHMAGTEKPQPSAHTAKPSTPLGNVTERPLGPIPASRIIPKLANCCELAIRTFTPDSWEDHDFCSECSTFRRFIRPMDEDSFFRSTRLAVDNLTHFRSSHYLLPNQPIIHHALGDIFKPFGSNAERYYQSRLHNGVFVYESAFGVVDFTSEEDALGAFRALQGRRIRGERLHWRLEFLDPQDVTFGDRLPIIHSKPPLELIRRLEEVRCEPERIDNILRPSSPLPQCGFSRLAKKKKPQVERPEVCRPPIKLDERREE